MNLIVLSGICVRIQLYDSRPGAPMTMLELLCRDIESGKWNNYIKTVCFGRVASQVAERAKDGTRLLLIGQLQVKRWKSAAGWRQRQQVRARAVYFDIIQQDHDWLDMALRLSALDSEESFALMEQLGIDRPDLTDRPPTDTVPTSEVKDAGPEVPPSEADS